MNLALIDPRGGNVSNLATVQSIYESFGKGDVPAILDVLADDVEWEAWDSNSAVKAGVPWMTPPAREGRRCSLLRDRWSDGHR